MIPAIITVRSASTRLPGKCFLPFGTGCVIEHVIRRAKNAGFDVVVCTTQESSDDRLQAIAEQENVKCFRGSVENKLKRWRDCCNHFSFEAFHTVDADDPFFDPNQVAASFSLLLTGDNDVVYPSHTSSAGLATVGFSIKKTLLDQIVSAYSDHHDTEMAWYFFEKLPGLKMARLVDFPCDISARLTLDYVEDYWLLASIVRLLGNDATNAEIIQLFRKNPDLHKINWFRNQEWSALQQKKGEESVSRNY